MKLIKKDGFEVAALLLILLLVIAIWVKTSSPMATQAKNRAFSAVFVDAVKPSIMADKRFSDVTIDVYTGNRGSILVRGSVSSDRIRDALIHFLDDRYPPRPIVYQLQILKESEIVGSETYLFSKVHAIDQPREKRVIIEDL